MALPEGPGTPAEVLLGRFGEYLALERGLAAGTVWDYVHAVRPFVAAVGGDGDLDLWGLSAAEDGVRGRSLPGPGAARRS